MFRTRQEPHAAEEAVHPSARALSLLLESMALHAIEDADADAHSFQVLIRGLAAQAEDAKGEQLLLLVREMIAAIRSYNQQVEEAVAQRESDWRGLCLTLLNTNTLLRSAIGSTVQIGDLRSEVASVSRLRDLRNVRAQIAGHLRSIESMAALRVRNSANADSDLSPAEIDPLTGLPDRVAAERIMTRFLAEEEPFYPVAIAVEKLESINNRFGFKTGDSLLLMISQHLAKSLPNDHIFRWRGGSFLLLLRRAEMAEHVRSELQRLSLHRKEYTIELENRSVALSVTCSWSLIPVNAQTVPETLLKNVDDFVTRQNSPVMPEERGRALPQFIRPRAALRMVR